MKKMLIVLLAAVLLFACAAVAEQAPAVVFQDEHVSFDVTMVVPEGYTPEQSQAGRYLHIHLVPQEADNAEYAVSVAYSELSHGQTLADMSQEDIDAIIAYVSHDFAGPDISYANTDAGSLIVIVDETLGASDYMTAVSLYKGYFVTVEIHKADFSQLHEEDVAKAMDLLSSMQFVEK